MVLASCSWYWPVKGERQSSATDLMVLAIGPSKVNDSSSNRSNGSCSMQLLLARQRQMIELWQQIKWFLLHATTIGPSKANDRAWKQIKWSLMAPVFWRLLTNLLPDSSVHSFASESMKLHSRRQPKNGSSLKLRLYSVQSGIQFRSSEERTHL